MKETILITIVIMVIMLGSGFTLANLLNWAFPNRSVVERFVIGVIVISVIGIVLFALDGDVILANIVSGVALFGLAIRSFMLWVMRKVPYSVLQESRSPGQDPVPLRREMRI